MKQQSSNNSWQEPESLSRDSSLEDLSTITWTLSKLDDKAEQDKLYTLAKWMKESTKTMVCAGPGVGNHSGLIKDVTSISSHTKPSTSHLVLSKLVESKVVDKVVSTNYDGLLYKSGIPLKSLFELRGNVNFEICINEDCQQKHFRDYVVRTAVPADDHETGRYCQNCHQELYDNVVSQSGVVDKDAKGWALYHAATMDLNIYFGSDLKDKDLSQIAMATKQNGGKLVIISSEKTPLSKYADLTIRVDGLKAIKLLMKQLDLEIPYFKLYRHVRIRMDECDDSGEGVVHVQGVDPDLTPFDFLK